MGGDCFVSSEKPARAQNQNSSREKLSHAPQENGGKQMKRVTCDLPPGYDPGLCARAYRCPGYHRVEDGTHIDCRIGVVVSSLKAGVSTFCRHVVV